MLIPKKCASFPFCTTKISTSCAPQMGCLARHLGAPSPKTIIQTCNGLIVSHQVRKNGAEVEAKLFLCMRVKWNADDSISLCSSIKMPQFYSKPYLILNENRHSQQYQVPKYIPKGKHFSPIKHCLILNTNYKNSLYAIFLLKPDTSFTVSFWGTSKMLRDNSRICSTEWKWLFYWIFSRGKSIFKKNV